jgi:hypothetical protein
MSTIESVAPISWKWTFGVTREFFPRLLRVGKRYRCLFLSPWAKTASGDQAPNLFPRTRRLFVPANYLKANCANAVNALCRGCERVSERRDFLELRLEPIQRQTGIQHRADKHVAANAADESP